MGLAILYRRLLSVLNHHITTGRHNDHGSKALLEHLDCLVEDRKIANAIPQILTLPPNERTKKPHPSLKQHASTHKQFNLFVFFNVLNCCFNNYPLVNHIHIRKFIMKQVAQDL